jgi:hypothetical protein
MADRDSAELREVSGNNQRGLPGEILAPLVVRLEDQFGNPLPGVEVRAEILRGGVEFVEGDTRETDADGMAQFRVRATAVPGIAVVDVTVPALLQVERVRFLLNRTRFAVGRRPGAVAIADDPDLNEDGHPDLVTANAGSNDVSIRLGRGDGTFEVTVRLVVGVGPAAVAVADFDGDGALDVVTANAGSGDVSILIGLGDGTFE